MGALYLGKRTSGYPKKIGQTVVVEISVTIAPTHVSSLHPQPRAHGDILEAKVSRVPVESHRVLGEVRLEHIQRTVVIEISNGDTHAGLLAAILVYGKTQLQALLCECAVAPVVKQQARRRVAGDVNFLPAVPVEVGRHRVQTEARVHSADARTCADVRERAVSVIVVEHGALGNQSARTAIHRNAFKITPRIFPGRWDLIEIENQIVGDEQVQAAVAIIVHPCTTSAPALTCMHKAGFL